MALLAIGLAPPSARAQQPTAGADECAEQRYVTLLAPGAFDAILLEEVHKDLATELLPRGFCVRAARVSGLEPAAEIELAMRDATRVAVRVDDHTTGKQVARDVSLRRIPAGGQALAIAIGIDELLRASWAELMLRPRASAPAEELASEPDALPARATVGAGATTRTAPQRRWGLGLLAAYSYAASDWSAFGPDLRLSFRPLRLLLLEAGAGGVWTLPVDTALGRARARGASALFSVQLCADPHARLNVCGGVRTHVTWVQFSAAASAEAQAHERSLVAVVLAAPVQLRVRLIERLALALEASLGAALRGARATDGTDTLLGLDGLVVSAGLGLEVAL
ncbi:MAG TPA: hypothetical protein VFZ61_03015 [Polyangiales bacterium]